MTVNFVPGGREDAWRWVIKYRLGPDWIRVVLPGIQSSHMFDASTALSPPDEVIVSAVDRVGNESRPTVAGVGPIPTRPAPPRRRR
jgi:hypothetical protein